jgi:hypothetical protein
MEKIDRLGWAAGVSFHSCGVRVGVRVNSAHALRLVQKRFPPGWKPASSRIVGRLYSIILNETRAGAGLRRYNLVYGNLERLARTTDTEAALATFESDLKLHVAAEATSRVFVHAGVVGWKGQAVLIPGHSYSGKSTLVAELVRAGATYYSDEYALLDSQGRAHPYMRDLEIRETATGEQRKHSVEEFGGKRGTKPLPVQVVIVSTYKPGARWTPRRLSPGEGLLEMLGQTVSARRQPSKAIVALEQVAKQALTLKGVRGEAVDMVAPILLMLEHEKESKHG